MSLSKIGKFSAAVKTLEAFNGKKGFSNLVTALQSTGNIAAGTNLITRYGKNLNSGLAYKALAKSFGEENITDEIKAAIGYSVAGTSGNVGNVSQLSNLESKAGAAFAGLGAFLKSIWPVLAVIGGISIGTAAWKWADDKFTLTKATAKKHSDESAQEYQEAKTELDSKQSQYDSNQDRIHKLRETENKTSDETAELSKLTKENSLLGTQISIQKKLVNAKAQQQAIDAEANLNKKYTTSQSVANEYSDNVVSKQEDIIEETTRKVNELAELQKRRDAAYVKLNSLSPDDEKYDEQAKIAKGFDDRVSKKQNEVADAIDEISDDYDRLFDSDTGELIDQKTKDTAKSVEKLYSLFGRVTDSATDETNRINNIFAKVKFDGVKDELINAGKLNGVDTVKSKIAEIDGLQEALDNAGISADVLAENIMAIAKPDEKNLEGIKENLKDIFDINENLNEGNSFIDPSGNLYNFFKDKTDKQIEDFWNYYTEQGLDASDWNFDDLAYNFNKSQSKEQVESSSFSSLFENSTEDTATDLDTVTDNFQTDMSNIKTAMDSIKTGTFQNSDITDLIQQFPELATETDDLQRGLEKLTFSKASTVIGKIRDSVKDITDPKELAAADRYVQSIMDVMDLSNISVKDMKDKISSNLVSNASDQIGRLIAPDTYNELMSRYGDDEYAIQAILKLSMDPSFVNDGLEDKISKIEDLTPQIHIDVDTAKLDTLSESLTRLQTEASQMQTDMNNKATLNQKVTALDYTNLINNGERQISNLKQQIFTNENLQTTVSKGSEQYKQYQDAINSAKASIDSIKVSQVEWEKERFNLPVTDITNLSSVISTALTEIQSSTGLTNDTIEGLKTQFSDLADADVENLFNRTAQGLQLDAKKLKDYLDQQNSFMNDEFTKQIENQISVVENYKKALDSGDKHYTDEGLQDEIKFLDRLLNRQTQYHAKYQEAVNQFTNLQLEEITNDLTRLEAEASRTQTDIDNKSIYNEKVDVRDYNNLIKNGDEQIKELQKQINFNKELQETTSKGSEQYKQYQDIIDAANSSINSIKVSQVEWGKASLNLPVTDMQNTVSVLTTAISEMQTETGLTSETIDILRTQFSDLKKTNVDAVFERTAKGLKINTDRMKDYLEQQNDFMNSDFANKIKNYQNELAKGNEKYTAAGLEQLRNLQAQYYAQYQEAAKQFSNFQNMVNAESAVNEGDEYTKAMEYLKTGKELLDDKLVGTEQFKAIAKYFSQNGFEDGGNFEENYKRLKGYYTEDTTGPVKFLNDLKSKGLAVYESLGDGNYQWKMIFDDTTDAANQMGMSLESFESILGRLKDYGFTLPLINSLEEGNLLLDEAQDDLIEEKIKLSKLKANNASQSAIEDQEAVISRLEAVYDSTNEAIDSYNTNAPNRQLKSLKEAKSVIDDFSKELSIVGENSDMGRRYIEAIQEYAEKNGIELTAEYEVDKKSYNKMIQQLESQINSEEINHYKDLYEQIKNGETVDNGDFDTSDTASVDVINKVIDAKQENNDSFLDAIKFLQSMDDSHLSELKQIKLGNGSYEFEDQELRDAEDALQGLATQFGLTTEQANMLLPVLQALGFIKVEPEVETSQIEESAQDGISKLRKMQAEADEDFKISFKVDDNIENLSVDDLQSQIEELESVKINFEVDSVEYQAIESMIEDREIQKHVKILIDQDGNIDKWINLSDKDLALAASIDLNTEDGQAKLETLRQTLQSLSDASANVTVKLDDTQFNALVGSQETTTVTVDADNEPAKAKIDEAVDYGNSAEAMMTINGNPSSAKAAANSAKSYAEGLRPVISIGGNADGVRSAIGSALTGPFTITVHANVVGMPNKDTAATGTMTSIAHADGTAYNVLNMKRLSPAHASGDVALKHNERALVNEQEMNGHSESIVRNGVWSLIPGGAHFENLRKGDIIFSAKQTDDLLKHGATPGHARTYAQGSVPGIQISSARASINDPGNNFYGNNKNPNPTYVQGNTDAVNNNTNSNNNLSNAVNNASDSLDDAIKKLNDNAMDWIEVALDRLDRKTEDHTSIAESDRSHYTKARKYYSLAIKDTEKEISAAKKAMAGYLAYANKIASNETIKKYLTPALITKIQNGTLAVETLSEEQKKAVDAYKTWYDKYLDAKDTYEEKTEQRLDLAQGKVENVYNSYEVTIGKREALEGYYDALAENRILHGKSQKEGSIYWKQLEKQKYYAEEQKRLTGNELKEVKKQMDNYLKVNGHNVKDKAYQEMKKQYYELKTTYMEADSHIQELTQKLEETRQAIIDWKVDRWDRAGSLQDAAINYREVSDNADLKLTEKTYTERIKTNNREINALQAAYDNMYADYQKNFSTFNNEEAQEKIEQLNEYKIKILELASANEEYKNSIMEIRWEPFYEIQDELSNVAKEYETAQKLLGDTESFYNDDGSFSENGLANILLTQESIDATKDKIANYQKGLELLDKQYKNGNWSLGEYKEKQQELLQGLQQESTALANLKKNMLDMYQTQITKENDLLQENINKRKEALDAKEDYYDYDRTLKKKSKDINALKAQIAALEGTKLLSFFI